MFTNSSEWLQWWNNINRPACYLLLSLFVFSSFFYYDMLLCFQALLLLWLLYILNKLHWLIDFNKYFKSGFHNSLQEVMLIKKKLNWHVTQNKHVRKRGKSSHHFLVHHCFVMCAVQLVLQHNLRYSIIEEFSRKQSHQLHNGGCNISWSFKIKENRDVTKSRKHINDLLTVVNIPSPSSTAPNFSLPFFLFFILKVSETRARFLFIPWAKIKYMRTILLAWLATSLKIDRHRNK